ncbi:unnamed protein product [Schistocephalus solidus]|uniref:Protocadherin-9 n=1 Tax=Schistocephalus solidus TaxID=70667 RepID=A0A183SK63_SCHSO|nr:unnamed protein product [Schistocephalus solidus]
MMLFARDLGNVLGKKSRFGAGASGVFEGVTICNASASAAASAGVVVAVGNDDDADDCDDALKRLIASHARREVGRPTKEIITYGSERRSDLRDLDLTTRPEVLAPLSGLFEANSLRSCARIITNMMNGESRFSLHATLLLLSILLPATLLHQSAAMVNELEFQIYEEVPIGTTIADLNRAIWKDSKPPGNLWNRFKIVNSEDPTSRLVEVSDKGRLLVARRIDREEICPTYGLPLLLGVDSFQDVPRSLNPSIGEAARRLMLSGSKSMFSIGDEQCSFLLKVAVAQQPEMAVGAATISTPTIPSLFPNGQESILEIRIIVIDVNDNEPFWPNNLQSHAIEFRDGDPAGKRQSLPLAIDLDRDENAQLTYSLGRDPSGYQGVEKDDEWNNLPFYLVHNPAEGLYLQTTREVDHEEASSYRLILKATDSVSKTSLDAQTPNRYRRPHTSSIPLKVVIQDINDNDPKFTRPVFMPSQPVLETTPVGSVILELTATDADSGNNGAFRFSFAPTAGWLPQVALAHHLFNVRPDGKVVVQNPLDVDRQWRMLESGGGSRKTDGIYPKQKAMEFNFKVLVRDEAEPSYARSSEALVNIVVVDENDEAPEIKVVRSPSKECIQSLGRMGSLPDGGFQTHPTQPAYACVFENSPLDTLVVTLKVNDPDFGGEDEFECNISNKNFTLLPEDFANSRLPAHQVHQVFNRPFDKTKTAGPTQYAILTAAPLDRELMPFQKVHIICSDREGHRTTQNLSILVGDVNDNKPNFLQEVMHYQVPENSSPGTVLKAFLPGGGGGDPGAGSGDSWRNVSIAALRNVLAQDLDVGKNGRIKYLLEENSEHAGQFSIDQFTGAISTRVSFDREKTDKFMLTILAVDHGEPELTGTGTAQVTITDVNDNPPKFAQETYTFQILENMPRNSRVGQVTATDLDDLMVQGPITYYLSADHDALGFNIEAKTGELVTRRPLDREEQPNYTFKVLARDSSGGSSSFGHTQHTATATVNVVLEDVNDNSPVFITPNATANTLTVAVTQTLGHRLAFIHAEDADEGLNGQVTYKIKAGNSLNLFSIDPQSGLLFLAESLTRLAELHSLPLDGGSARKTGNDSDTEGENTARMLQLSTQPTVHVLTLEACDNAEEAPRCTVSTNLRIHVQPGASMLAGREEMRRYYADQHFHPVVSGGGENAVEGSSQLSGDQKAAGWGGVPGTGPRGGRGISAFVGSSSEIIIICMSVLFIILLVIILALTVFFRSCKLGPSKNLSISATHRSLSRSKSPAYTTSMHTAELGQLTSAELAISQSLTSSGAVLTGSQSSDMILDGLRHVGALPLRGGISSSQSFFEMPKSIHEFSCQGLMPCPEDVRNNFTVTGGVAGHAAGFQQTTIGTRQELARSADLLYLPKGSVNLVNKEGPMVGV